MLKKSLYLLMFMVITVGAVYSYQKVDFGRKTAMFFKVAFGSGNEMEGRYGRPPMGEFRGRGLSRHAPPSGQAAGPVFRGGAPGRHFEGKGGGRGARPEFQQGENRGSRPPRGSEGRRVPGGVISLGKVGAYTIIMAFVVMIIRFLDRLIIKIRRSKQYV